MRRASTFYFCLMAVLIGMPPRAFGQGGGKGWIERFSGPGPWDGWEGHSPFACVAKAKEADIPGNQAGNQARDKFTHLGNCYNQLKYEEPSWWFEFELGRYKSEDDPLVNNTTLNLTTVEVRAATAVRSTGGIVNLGFGAGAYYFTGDAFDGFGKFAVPVRIEVLPLKPLLGKKWGSVFQLWTKATFLAGRLSGENFGVPESGFDENWEAVPSYGIVFDFREVLR